MSKVLFFFTSEYPFGNGETFIENEMPFLANHFDKIVIISNNCDGKQTRQVPENVCIKRFPYELNKFDRLQSMKGIFNPLFWQEISCIKKIYKKKISSLILKTVLISLQKASVFGRFFSKLITEQSTKDDTIIAYSYWANDTAFALAQMRRRTPYIKMCCRAHRWDIYFEENQSGYLPFRLVLLKNLDAIFVISEHGKTYIESLLAEKFQTLKVSRLGVLKHNLSLPSDQEFTIGTISNIIPVKNLFKLVDALSNLDFNFTWFHIGDGIQRMELEKLAHEKIPAKYQFLGQMSNTKVMSFLEKTPISLFINISLSEGIPVSIMEAFSCGIPVLATNVGGNFEIVDNSNGILLSVDPDTNEIVEAISKFKNLSNSQKQKLKENAYNTWDEKYNAEKNYQAFIKQILTF